MRSVLAVSLDASRVVIATSLLFAVACGGGDSTAPPAPPAANAVIVVSGSNQHARITRTLAEPIVVLAQSATGAAVSGASVSFTANSGTVDPASATTDAAGRATVRWTLGAAAGTQTLTVRLASGAGAPVALSAIADPALDALVTVLDGNNQQAVVGTPVFIPPTVRVTDGSGAPVSDVRLRFVASAGSAVAVSEPRTDSDGRATVGAWTMGNAPGAPQVVVTIADADVVSSAPLPTFSAIAVPVGGVATAPARTYTLNTNAPSSIPDTVTGWRVHFPSGGHGTLTVARVVAGPSLPDVGAIRATVQFSGTERVELNVSRPSGGEIDGYLYGQIFDALTSGRDTVRWWGLPALRVQADTVVFLLQPAAVALRTAANTRMMTSLVANARPSVQAYATVPLPAGSPGLAVRAQLRAATRQTLDWWLANLPPGDATRLQTAIDANPYALSFGTSGESYYWNSLFTGYTPTIYYNTSRDIAHITRHEPAHFITHMLVGGTRYSALLASAPGEGHDLGIVAAGFRQSMIEEYAHFSEFLINGTLTNWDLRSMSSQLGVRNLMAPFTPSSADYPSLEGFGGIMLAALSRAGADTLVADFFAAGSRTRAPALDVPTSQLLGVLASGPLTPDDLRAALMVAAGGEQSLAAVLEPVGWSYNGLGRVLDGNGVPVQGAEIASVVRVGSKDYRTTGSTPTGADGRFYLPRMYPGTSRLRLYKPRVSGGTDSVELGALVIPWTTPTSQSITIADQQLAAYEFGNVGVTVGNWIVQNSANPSQQWACVNTGSATTNPFDASGGPRLATLQWSGADFTASGTVPFVTADWRANHTLSIAGTMRPGTGDTTWTDINGTYQMITEDLRYDTPTESYKWKLTTDARFQFRLHDVPLIRSGDRMAAYLRQSVATGVFSSGSLYYFHKDWSHPEFDAQCQTSAIDPTNFAVNVYFSR